MGVFSAQDSAHRAVETESTLDVSLGRLLHAGVAIAAAVVLAGGILYVARFGTQHPLYGRFVGEPSELRSVAGTIHAAFTMSARGIIQLGLLILVATPVARVVLSVIAFARARDWTYVWISSVVLALLALSLAGVVG